MSHLVCSFPKTQRRHGRTLMFPESATLDSPRCTKGVKMCISSHSFLSILSVTIAWLHFKYKLFLLNKEKCWKKQSMNIYQSVPCDSASEKNMYSVYFLCHTVSGSDFFKKNKKCVSLVNYYDSC